MTQARFREFHQETSRQVWSYLFRLTNDMELAKDLTQETYIRYLQSSAAIESTAAARSYLFSIATNLTRDHWRRGTVRGRWEDEHETEPMDEFADALSLRLDLAAAMEQLTLMQRSLLWLTYVEGYSHQEVAAIQKLQPDSVKVLLSRARARLAKICREMGIAKESRS